MSLARDKLIIFRPGNPPETAGWPGGEYSDETVGDLRIQRNVAVPMRDGLNLLVDLYQPAQHDDRDPRARRLVAVRQARRARLERLARPRGRPGPASRPTPPSRPPTPPTGPAQGYSVILADARGTWGSQGDVTMFDRADAEACYDLIEWAGTQEWSNGKVGMAGVSWYAVIQWAVAALRPPHLAAINPWEGFSDLYNEVATHGGIPETQFTPMLGPLIANTHGQVEDVAANAMNHPFYDEYWQGKVADHVRHRRPGLRGRQLDRPWPAHPRNARGLQPDGVCAEVAGDPRPQEVGVLLRTGQRRPADGLLRPFPQGRAQRGRHLAARPARGPRAGQRRGRPGRAGVATGPDQYTPLYLDAR